MHPLTGRLLWLQLHTFAHALPEGDFTPDTQAAVRAFLHAWEASIDQASAGQCPCSSHWAALRDARPPVLTSRRAFYWWTVQIHDDVNARLGRPLAFPALRQ
jgi:hypothetical protein